MMMRQLYDQDTNTFTYLVGDESTKSALILDPVLHHVDRDARLVEELGYRLELVLDTHVHADHVTGAGALRDKTGAKVVVSHRGSEAADIHVKDGDTLKLGALSVEVLETPGHTDDSVSYKLGDNVFTGDALFVRGTGRTDFQNGNAHELYDSIVTKIFTLPDSTKIWPGHDYRGHSMTTVGEEKALNPRLANKTKEQFVEIMAALDLPAPRYLDVAVPANRELGLGLSASEADGVEESGPEDVDAYQNNPKATVLDVRETHEFNGELGHIEGAINVPRGEIAQAAPSWDFDSPMLVVCRSGRRSRAVCQQLMNRGFRHVVNLRGGMLAYREARAASDPPEGDGTEARRRSGAIPKVGHAQA